MKSLKSDITINASPATVWTMLTTFNDYPLWNPFIISISGETKVGSNLDVTIKPPESNAMKFKPVVLVSDENKEFRWKGKFIINGLFDGEHYFLLKDNGDGSTTFTQGENFSGLLVGLMANALEKTLDGFNVMNQALKQKCET